MILCDKLQWEKCEFAQCNSSSCVSEQTSGSLAAYLHQHWNAVWHTRLVQTAITSLYTPLKCRTNNTMSNTNLSLLLVFLFMSYDQTLLILQGVSAPSSPRMTAVEKKPHLNKAHAILQKIFLCHLCIERKTVTPVVAFYAFIVHWCTDAKPFVL